jgi:predicted MFS family arabinose efflux permease
MKRLGPSAAIAVASENPAPTVVAECIDPVGAPNGAEPGAAVPPLDPLDPFDPLGSPVVVSVPSPVVANPPQPVAKTPTAMNVKSPIRIIILSAYKRRPHTAKFSTEPRVDITGVISVDEAMADPKNERAIIFLVGAVQFINIVDFMIVMPLGPDFSSALGIPVSELGTVGGSYTAAASIAGLLGSLFLDKFDRKRALVVAMLGLVVGTALGSVARGLVSMVIARVVAGAFGGPATSISYSIIADVVPPERRGKAMGSVMAAFGVASVVGVPLGLELSRRLMWRAPFIAVASAGLLITLAAAFLLPPLRDHLDRPSHGGAIAHLRGLVRSDVLTCYLMAFVVMMGTFVVVPNISAYVMENLHYPRPRLGLLYFAGGLVNLLTTRFIGVLIDRYGSALIGSIGSIAMSVIMWAGFGAFPPLLTPMPVFIFFMMSSSFRSVSYNTLVSKVPQPEERASFSSVQSAVQHMAAASGAFLSARMLSENASHELVGMPSVTWLAIAISCALPPLLVIVERRVARK